MSLSRQTDPAELVPDNAQAPVVDVSSHWPSRSQSAPKLGAFAHFAQKRMRRDFRAGDYLPTVLP